MKKLLSFLCVLAVCLGVVPTTGATSLILSTDTRATLGGVTFEDGDLVKYDTDTDAATLFFSESLFSDNEEVDAVAVLSSGNIILSTTGEATLGGLTFDGGDLVEYNPGTSSSSIFFDGTLFFEPENINAVTVLSNGNVVLSVRGNNGCTLGGVRFKDGDLIEYDPGTGTAALLFDENWFSGDADIDAVGLLANNNLLLSTNEGTTLEGLTFKDGDLVEFDPGTRSVNLFFDENLFSQDADINGVSVIQGIHSPEPSTMILLILGLAGLAGLNRNKFKA